MIYLRYWKLALGIALLLGLLYYRADAATSAAQAKAALDRATALQGQLVASERAREQEAASAKAANEVAAQYERDKQDAEARQGRLVADLRAGNVRLRQQWQGCADRLPTVAGTPGEPDGAADQRNEGASNLVRIAAESDAQVRALQDFIREALK